MSSFGVFDAVCTVGRHRTLGEGGLHTAEHLLADMGHFGISEVLVLDSLSRENHPADGNERIIGVAKMSPRFHPAWALLPPGTDEQPKPDALVRKMREQKVGAAFLFTGIYRFPLSDWCVDALLEPLADAGTPVFITPNDHTVMGWDETNWDAVVALCRRWPKLPVIVSEWRIRRAQRAIYRALEACDNLHIELSGYWLGRGIEYITRRFGAERLIFGSNWPQFGHGQTLATLTCAEIPDREKRMIAGDNLRRLLSWCEPKHFPVGLAEPEDNLVRFGRTGQRPDDLAIHDCHGHIGGRMCHYHVPDGDLDSTVREMERLGITRGCIFSFTGVTSDEVFGNDVTAEAVARYPDRFVGFCLLNPHRGEREMLREIERCAAMGMRGIKLIPHYQGYPEEGPDIDVACRWAHEHKWVILNHSWGSPEQMGRLLRTYSDACYIAGHTTGAYAELMKQYDNLHVCTCPLLGPRDCESMVDLLGADRLLFGSDLQDLPIPWGLGPILFARIPEQQKRLILGGNLERILSRYSLG